MAARDEYIKKLREKDYICLSNSIHQQNHDPAWPEQGKPHLDTAGQECSTVKIKMAMPHDRRREGPHEGHPLPHGCQVTNVCGNRSHPDIAFAVAHLSQFSSNPGPEHWTATQQVVRHLAPTCSMTLVLEGRTHLYFTDGLTQTGDLMSTVED
jgi:hypothetical protein